MEHMPATPDSECIHTARELQVLLEQEKDVLKRFAGNELLSLIPQKEFLVSELRSKLVCLKSREDVSATLKELLSQINEMNTANGLFIKKSLSHWQDLLAIFIPPSYGPGGSGGGAAPRTRGLTFSREI